MACNPLYPFRSDGFLCQLNGLCRFCFFYSRLFRTFAKYFSYIMTLSLQGVSWKQK